jgi:hypothetical protein
MTWANWLNEHSTSVAATTINGRLVSTVFLALDHSWGAPGPPLLWETMIINASPEYQQRYRSRAAAVRGHEDACGAAALMNAHQRLTAVEHYYDGEEVWD